MEDRQRRIPRLRAAWLGRYRFEKDPEGLWRECQVEDISLIGVGAELMDIEPLIPLNLRIVIEVAAPAGGSVKLRLEGETRNVSPGNSGGIRVGIEFANLSDTERSILDVFSQMQFVW